MIEAVTIPSASKYIEVFGKKRGLASLLINFKCSQC